MFRDDTCLEVLHKFTVTTDHDDRICDVNSAFCQLAGQDRAALIGKYCDLYSLIPGAQTQISHTIDASTTLTHISLQQEQEHKLTAWHKRQEKGGQTLYQGTIIENDTGQYDADATDTPKMRFLATMSHEMRTPLNGILGLTGLLLETNLDPNQRTYAEAVRQSGEALLALINDILDYSKAESGKMELEMTMINPLTLMQGVVELLSPRAAEKELELGCYVDPSVPEALVGDEARLRQILLNLAGNGVKFTEQGGVNIEAYATPLNDDDTKVQLRIDVHDTGIGIAEEKIDLIFDAFTQADSTHARNYEGTGLGLPITRQIAQAMSGDVHVTSTLGKGSVFSILVPLEKQPVAKIENTLPKLVRPVIILTHSPVLQRALRLQLRALTASPHYIATSSDDALALMRQHENATLLCDLDFAHDDAHRLTQAAGTSIILLSPIVRGQLETFLQLGFDGYLIKPIRQTSLHQQLAQTHHANHAPDRLDNLVSAYKAPLSRRRILLAEDNQINAVLATAIIKRIGHHIDVAGDGVEAVRMVTTAPYDIVLMDMRMPRMDGLAASRAIRKLSGPVASVPIIALTANAMRSDKQVCLEAGMDDFLSKPFEPSELVALIDKWTSTPPDTVARNARHA